MSLECVDFGSIWTVAQLRSSSSPLFKFAHMGTYHLPQGPLCLSPVCVIGGHMDCSLGHFSHPSGRPVSLVNVSSYIKSNDLGE